MRAALFSLLMLASVQTMAATTEKSKEEAHNDWDLSIKLGLAIGTVTEGPDSARVPNSFAGNPVAFCWNHDLMRKLGMFGQFELVADLVNGQVSRLGLDFGFTYHLLGGAKFYRRDYGFVNYTFKNPYSISLVARGAFQNYSASLASDPTKDQLTGNVLVGYGGIETRWDISEMSSLALEASYSIYGLPMSSERLSVNLFEIYLSWRFLL